MSVCGVAMAHLTGPDFAAIFAAVPGPLLVLSPDLRMVAANADRYAATMTTPEQTIGRYLFDLFPDNPDNPAAEGVRNLRASLDRVRSTLQPDAMPIQKYDIARPESEGGGFEERFWSPVNTPVVVAGELAYIIHGVVDVTEYVRLEQRGELQAQQLQGEKQQLAAEILTRQREAADTSRQLKELNAELSVLYERSQELDRAKSTFFANMSHELRTPLTLILGRAQRLLDDPEALTPENAEQVRSILANGQVLLYQVNQLLEAATLESGQAALEWCDLSLAQLVRRTVATFESAAVDAGIDLRLVPADGDVAVQGDQRRLAGVVGNLVANAVKFTPRDGTVRVSVAADGVGARIEVADSGPGIPSDMREAVFERFRQVDGGSGRMFGGTGLGLSIVKDTVLLHGGSVTAAGSPEGGALISVWLPRRAPEGTAIAGGEIDTGTAGQAAGAVSAQQRIDGARAASGGTAAPGDRRTVLVVEDNADLAAFIADELGAQHHILQAGDGREALGMLSRHHVDLVLTDVMMPGMDGETLLREMKADPRYEEIPVVVLTARTDPALRVRLLQQRAADFLSKPFSPAELRARIGNVADAASLRQVLETRVRQRTRERDAVNRRLAFTITHDTVTRLPNRMFLLERIDELLTGRAGPPGIGVLYVGVDDLQRINEGLGHAAGNAVLRAIGQRMRELVPTGGIVARSVGDEFVVAHPLHRPDQAWDLAARLRHEVSRPVAVGGEEVVVTASIGASAWQAGRTGVTAESLLQEAELAMQRAKKSGKNAVEVFDESLQHAAEARLAIEQALRHALRDGELQLHYQPELDLRTGRVVAFEALIRWQHPQRGLLLPGEFLPVAKGAGLMPEIDEFVLRTACADSLRWRRLLRETGGRVWMNLSAELLRSRDLPAVVAAAARTAGTPAEFVGVEITETLATDSGQDVSHFRELTAQGVAMAIDDFGTGYSSLANLRHFPASVLKLDQSLVADISGSADASSIARAAIDMGHTLGLTVLAEGVETVQQRDRLEELECDIGQGWHFGVPEPAARSRS